jgi:hypothetical protein
MRVYLLAIIAALTISQAMAQQPADQQSAAAPTPIVGRAAATITAEGQRKGALLTYQDRNLAAQDYYYSWRDGCYIRYPSGVFQSVPLESCR